jgi:hypothetical protein
MRLLDRILSDGFRSFRPEVDVSEIKTCLTTAQLIVVDNVAAFHFQDLKRKLTEDQQMQVSDFPNVMLPFETTFLEMRIKDNENFAATFEECGILAQMRKPGSLDYSRVKNFQEGDLERMRAVLFHKDTAYHMTCLFFFYARQLGKPIYAAIFSLPVSADGQILGADGNLSIIGKLHMPDLAGAPAQEEDFLWYLGRTFLHPCLLALSFMHCRNVKVIDEMPPPKLSKKFKRKTGRPLLRYRMLMIDHMKEILEHEGHMSTDGLKRALHICRGHFASYGKSGKGLLFGKHVATVWVPMHLRGSTEEGAVIKDYDVK